MQHDLGGKPDFTLEASIPTAPLESILCTEQLHRRPSRPPDYEKDNRSHSFKTHARLPRGKQGLSVGVESALSDRLPGSKHGGRTLSGLFYERSDWAWLRHVHRMTSLDLHYLVP